MYEDFPDYEEVDLSKKNNFDIKFLLYGILIIVLIGVFYLVFFESKTYSSYEKRLVSSAQKYVNTNDLLTYKEIYLDNSKLKVDLPSNCADTSGVLYNGKEYVPYLICSDYETEIIKNNAQNIKLIGDSVNILIKERNYYELGYSSNLDVTITGDVGSEEGVYNLYYITSSSEVVTRKVIVIDNINFLKNYPSIKLVGENIEKVELNKNYIDLGVEARDSIDGDITSLTTVVGEVNPFKKGEYILYYTVKNSRGYKSSVIRKVLVTDSESNIEIFTDLSSSNTTNKEVSIIFNILGSDYSHTILPNNSINKLNNFQYKVSENGIYDFQIIDKNGNTIDKKVEVKNIVKQAPIGICYATTYSDYTEISVNITSEGEIMGYNFIIDGKESGYRIVNEYKSSVSKPNSVIVNVRDIVGNETRMTCNIEESTTNPYQNSLGYTKTLSGDKLRMPIKTALANKNHTVYDLNTCIYNRVIKAGVGTRYGVMEAGVALLECTKEMTGFIYSYEYCAAKVESIEDCNSNPDICGKLGINTKWGNSNYGGCCKNGGSCYNGFSCAGFVRWSLCNGGMNKCSVGSSNGAKTLISEKSLPGADSFEIYGNSVTYKYGNNLSYLNAIELLRKAQPGDVVRSYKREDTDGSTEHIMLIVGNDGTSLYIGENGDKIIRVPYSKYTSGEAAYQFAFLDNYYNNPNNKNTLYK